MIKNHWKYKKIGEFAKVIGGGTPSKKNEAFFGGEISWITPKDLSNYNFKRIDKGATNLTKLGLKNSSAKLFPKDTVLFSSRAPIGYVAIAEKELCTSQGFRSLICNDKIAYSEYVYYLLKYNSSLIESKASGSTFKEISGTKLANIQLPLPNISVQKKISIILSNYDDLIENNLRRIQILMNINQKIFQKWFVNFDFFSHKGNHLKKSELGKIPHNWKIKKLLDVADISWGDTNVTKASYVDEGYPAYSASGMDGKLPYYDYERDAVILSAIGANCGFTWFASGKWSCIKNTIRIFSNTDELSNEFIFYYSYGKDFWPKRGSAQPFISQGDIQKLSIIVPTKKLLDEFTNLAKNNLKLINILTNANDYLKTIRDILLNKLLSNKIDISNLDIEENNKVA